MDLKDLQGKKTYLTALATAAYALGGYFSGYLEVNAMMELLFLALGLGGLRNSISVASHESPKDE